MDNGPVVPGTIHRVPAAMALRICPHCGKESAEESPRFCSGCGARMDGGIPPGSPAYGGTGRVEKNATMAGFCSSVLPGLGQVYNGETLKGVILFFLTLAGFFIFLIPGFIVWLYAMYDAHAVAGKMNTGEVEFKEMQMLPMILFIAGAVIVILFVLIAVTLVVFSSLMARLGPVDTTSLNRLFTLK